MKSSIDPNCGLAIGPANYSGQATLWARAVQEHLSVRSWSFARHDPYGYGGARPLDVGSGHTAPRLDLTAPQLRSVLDGASHVAVDGFFPLSGGRLTRSLARDLKMLAADGRSVALISHGSDLRKPVAHMARVRNSWFKGAPARYVASSLAHSQLNARLWRSSGLPLFVPTPDLLTDFPDATWLPLTVDVDEWATDTPPFEHSGPPRVLHCPTRRKPAIKGSDIIEERMRALEDEGRITYVAPRQMPHHALRAQIQRADVVIDQIRGDLYATTSCEALAAGRLVISSVLGSREHVNDEIPIVDATPDNLERIVRDIANRPDRYGDLVEQGPRFARKYHGGLKAAQAMSSWLGLPPPAPQGSLELAR